MLTRQPLPALPGPTDEKMLACTGREAETEHGGCCFCF
jgi:hypothetical protein